MPVGPQEVVMRDNMFVEISWRRESSMKIKCEIEDNFIFPWIGGIASSKDFLWFNTGETTYDQGMSDDFFHYPRRKETNFPFRLDTRIYLRRCSDRYIR